MDCSTNAHTAQPSDTDEIGVLNKAPTFAQVWHWAGDLILAESQPTTLAVYYVLISSARNDTRIARVKKQTLQERAHVSRNTLDGALAFLTEHQIIAITHNWVDGKQVGSTYAILGPPQTAAPSQNLRTSQKLTGSASQKLTGKDQGTSQKLRDQLLDDLQPSLDATLFPGSVNGTSEEAPKQNRAPDPLFDALVAAVGWNYAEMTDTQRRTTATAKAELARVGATPDEIARRAVAYREKYRNAALTPSALKSQWAALSGAVKASTNGTAVADRALVADLAMFVRRYDDKAMGMFVEKHGPFPDRLWGLYDATYPDPIYRVAPDVTVAS